MPVNYCKDGCMELMAKQSIIQTVSAYGTRLFGFIRSRVNSDEDAEDILQEVWFQLSNRGEVETLESVSGWLYRVAKNKIIDRSRKKKDELLEDFGTEDEEGAFQLPDYLLATFNDPSSESLRKLFWEELTNALNELPEKQRNVFVWNELEEMTLQQIADQEQENIKTIISRKRYAVQHLRKRLEDLYNEFLND
ncbi:sigma-70 family RNA polymerase sigma factor [Lacibacter sp. MH-610]|uniref:RNA polymerase sigma factor n=1 Tax=Lacibacter sp. MH-610 TaxID=3020883 RepID=UPI00389195FA